TYSSGMYMRLGFAIAAHLDSDVLLLDEVFAVGDESFQRKCFGKIFEFKQRGGTIVFVSHDASSVERLCERAVLLREGRLEFDGTTHDAIVRYHRQLADERDPAERGAGLREWGSGEVRIAAVELQGPERRAPLPPARRRGELRRLPGRRRARRPAARGPLVEGGNRDGRRTPESMSSRTCPDWPALMELAPDLQFKHYTVAEAHLPAE